MYVTEAPPSAVDAAGTTWRDGVTNILARCTTLDDVRDRLLAFAAARPGEIAEFARILLGDDALAAREAARALGRIGSPGAFIALVGLSHAVPEGPLRREVLDAIAGISNIQSAEILTEVLLVSDDAQLALMSQIALAGMMDPARLAGIGDAVRGATTPEEQRALLGVIQQIRNPQLVEALIGLDGAADDAACEGPLGRSVVDTLGAIGTARATEELLSRIQRNAAGGAGTDVIRRAVARTVNPAALPALAAAAQNPVLAPETRAAAFDALGNFGTPEVGDVLQRGAGDPVDAVRKSAARSLLRTRGVRD